MKQIDIARKHGVSAMQVSNLIRQQRNTCNRNLAIEVSKLSGKAPIEHISPRVREVYAKAYPELKKPPLPHEREGNGRGNKEDAA